MLDHRWRAIASAVANPVSYTHLTLPKSDLMKISVVAGSLKKKKNAEEIKACLLYTTYADDKASSEVL